MNRENELVNYLKQPVLEYISARGLLLPARIRWVHKSYGGRNKGLWSVFKASELPPHKGFSDALVATLVAKHLLILFSKDSNRAFFLRESVVDYITKDQEYIYDSIKVIDKYKRL